MSSARGPYRSDWFDFGRERIPYSLPYDYAYLVDNTNGRDVYSDTNDVLDYLGKVVVTMSVAAAGKKTGDIWDNVGTQVADQHQWDGKRASYLGLGIGQLVYEPKRLAMPYSHELAVWMLERMFGPDLDDESDESARRCCGPFCRQSGCTLCGDEV